MSATTTPRHQYAVLVDHDVTDYDTWKPFFDRDEGPRKMNGFTGHCVYRVENNPNKVLIVLFNNDLEKAKGMTQSEELKKIMKEAGVIGAPSFNFGLFHLNSLDMHKTGSGILAFHPVKDFDAWFTGYDSPAAHAARAKAGVTGAAVFTNVDRPNDVWVIHQGDSIERLKQFASSPELLAVQEKAGVIGKTVYQFVNEAGSKVY